MKEKKYSVCRYFDYMLEAVEETGLSKGEAYKLKDRLNSKERYYVFYDVVEE